MKFFARTLIWASLPLILLYIVAPLLVYFFPHFMQHIFFLNFVKIPYREYHNLSAHGVDVHGHNFYLRVDDQESGAEVELGVWHILPKSLSRNYAATPSREEMEKLLAESDHPVVVYLHGNSFDRTTSQRVELYRILSNHDFHVIAGDYRGYGDSTGRPTEDGIVADARALYEYAKVRSPNRPIYVWGHSMGTGVATRLVAELSDIAQAPNALVLESPFNNLPDVINHHPFSTPFRFLPWFNSLVVKPLMDSGLVMSSDTRIQRITCPILVLHAEDDHIIPIKLGRKLVRAAKQSGRIVKFVEFEAHRGFLHKYIHKAPEMPETVKMSKSLLGDTATWVKVCLMTETNGLTLNELRAKFKSQALPPPLDERVKKIGHASLEAYLRASPEFSLSGSGPNLVVRIKMVEVPTEAQKVAEVIQNPDTKKFKQKPIDAKHPSEFGKKTGFNANYVPLGNTRRFGPPPSPPRSPVPERSGSGVYPTSSTSAEHLDQERIFQSRSSAFSDYKRDNRQPDRATPREGDYSRSHEHTNVTRQPSNEYSSEPSEKIIRRNSDSLEEDSYTAEDLKSLSADILRSVGVCVDNLLRDIVNISDEIDMGNEASSLKVQRILRDHGLTRLSMEDIAKLMQFFYGWNVFVEPYKIFFTPEDTYLDPETFLANAFRIREEKIQEGVRTKCILLKYDIDKHLAVIRPEDWEEQYSVLCRQLKHVKHFCTLTPCKIPIYGLPVLYQPDGEEELLRGVISEWALEHVDVHLVDFGKIVRVKNPAQISEMPCSLLNYPPFVLLFRPRETDCPINENELYTVKFSSYGYEGEQRIMSGHWSPNN